MDNLHYKIFCYRIDFPSQLVVNEENHIEKNFTLKKQSTTIKYLIDTDSHNAQLRLAKVLYLEYKQFTIIELFSMEIEELLRLLEEKGIVARETKKLPVVVQYEEADEKDYQTYNKQKLSYLLMGVRDFLCQNEDEKKLIGSLIERNKQTYEQNYIEKGIANQKNSENISEEITQESAEKK